MFERFTSGARQVVVLAQQDANALQHRHVGTEHLLVGLLAEVDGIAAAAAMRQRVLTTLGKVA